MASNPNKANQHVPDPRQSLFLAYYLDPKSETFSHAYASAVKSGYSEEYAKNITGQMPTWLSESIRDNEMLALAEKRLKQILNFEPVNEEGKIDNALLANQMKAVTLVAKGIGKAKYSERQEVTGKDGAALSILFDESLKDEASR